jgi:hypothetical protein
MERGRCTNRQIGHGHVIVDRSDKADYLQMSVELGLLLGNLACDRITFVSLTAVRTAATYPFVTDPQRAQAIRLAICPLQ